MKLSIDTKEDSHEDIRKAIKMLQNIVGDSQETFTNQPNASANESSGNAFNNLFVDTSSSQNPASEIAATVENKPEEQASESSEDLFAELFSEEEIKKMSDVKIKEDEEDTEVKSKGKRPSIELY